MNHSIKTWSKRGLLAMALLAGVATAAAPAWAAEIRWRELVFTKTTFEEDVKVVLREVLKRNGQEVFFRPGVEGDVTFEFVNMPLEAAFNKLMEERELCHTYTESTNTVTVYQCKAQTQVEDIFVPKNSSLADIMSALRRFRILDDTVRVSSDNATNSLFLSGDQNRVSELKRLAGQVDEAFKSKQEKNLLDQQRQQEQWQREMERKSVERDATDSEIEVRIIPLRFANVGATTTTFQGESVTVPGIIDSLKAFVGPVEIRGAGEKKSVDGKTSLPTFEPGSRPIISIDRRTNSVIVQGTLLQAEKIQAVIQELDRPVPLVEIEVMVVTGSEDLSRTLGVAWGSNSKYGPNAEAAKPVDDVVSDGTVSNIDLTAAGTGTMEKTGISQVASTTAGLGAAFLYQGTRVLLDATLSSLESEDKAHTLAAPRVVTVNNMPAKITSTRNYNFVVNSATNNGDQSGIETISSDLTLDITPSVIPAKVKGGGRLVRMDIKVKNSNPNTSGAAGSDVTTDEQEIQSSVIIPENGTFVMGGLFTNDRVENETGVPLLRDIPLLGAAFRQTTSSEERKETVFFITPKIYTSEQLARTAGALMNGYKEVEQDKLREEHDKLLSDSRLLDLSHEVAEDE